VRTRGRVRSETGSALIELAVALPLLVAVMIVTIDFARVFYLGISLTNAARAGAQYGTHTLAQSDPVTGMMQTTATTATNTTGMTATATRLCQCATDAAVLSPTSPSPNECIRPEATACPSGHRLITVTVTTSKSFSTIMSAVPGVPNPLTLTRSVTQRVVQ
jgi:Flp pilus assembly protein TadG